MSNFCLRYVAAPHEPIENSISDRGSSHPFLRNTGVKVERPLAWSSRRIVA